MSGWRNGVARDSTTSATDAEYDVVFLSTGLVESVAAAALAAVGRNVLQIEKGEQYGSSTWSTLELRTGGAGGGGHGGAGGGGHGGAGSATASDPPCFAPFTPSAPPVGRAPNRAPASASSIHVDLNPRLAYADGPLISLLLASGAHNHTEFVFCKTVVWNDGAFVGVAASKGDVFKDGSLTLSQKNSLMRALKDLAEDGAPWGKVRAEVFGSTMGAEQPRADEDTRPCTQPTKCTKTIAQTQVSSLLDDAQVTDRIVHGACLADDRRSMDRLAGGLIATYGRSIGKYGKTSASSPFLYPKYGVGELCSAFSRRAAVAGAVQMLRCEARVEVARGESETARGTERAQLFHVWVRGEDGMERRVSAAAVVGGPASPAPSSENEGATRTIRCVALVRGRLIGRHPDSNNYLAAFPGPRTTWMLQLDGSSGCCEPGRHTVVHLWTSDRERCGPGKASEACASEACASEACASGACASGACAAGACGSPPQPLADEFREILLRHFDCSQIFGDVVGNPPPDGAPLVEALWTARERETGRCNVSRAIDQPTPGIITDYDGRLARDGLASFVGLAEEAERLFRRVCDDNDVPFPYGEHTRARSDAREADSDDDEERMLGELSDLLSM